MSIAKQLKEYQLEESTPKEAPIPKSFSSFNDNPWTANQAFFKEDYKVDLTEKECLYLYRQDTEDYVKLDLIPDNVTESYSQRILSESGIFGRTTPIKFYAGGGDKSISFSFKLIEDLNNENGSLYNLLERLRSMTMPYEKRDYSIIPPVVYLQLGKQFAGLGHIQFSYDLNVPYRNGRFILANCSITFTYHEEFEGNNQILNIQGNQETELFYADSVQGILDFYNGTRNDNESIDDFLGGNNIHGNVEYFITNSFEELKLNEFLNTISLKPDSPFLKENSERPSVIKVNTTQGYVYQSTSSINPFMLNAYSLYQDLVDILGVHYASNRKQNLEVFLNKLEKLHGEYLNSTYPGKPGIGYYIIEPIKLVQMSDKEKKLYNDLISNIVTTASVQLDIIRALEGAGR